MGSFWILPLLRPVYEMVDELGGPGTPTESETLLSCLRDVSGSDLARAKDYLD
jgi:hypothetical protein